MNTTRRRYIPVVILITIYIVVFTVFTIGRYTRYNATGWDLGIFTQLTWNAAHGHFLHNTIAEQNNMLGVHAPYITILLAPLASVKMSCNVSCSMRGNSSRSRRVFK